MQLDPRVPLGWMFTLAGGILVFFGTATTDRAAIYTVSLGINANLWWGLPVLAFGLTMFVQGQRAQKKIEQAKDAHRLPSRTR